MKKQYKEFGKESMYLVGAGIGISALSGIDSSGASAGLASGIGKVAPLVPFKLATGILTDINKQISKKRY